jgi:hypothetical protein
LDKSKAVRQLHDSKTANDGGKYIARNFIVKTFLKEREHHWRISIEQPVGSVREPSIPGKAVCWVANYPKI